MRIFTILSSPYLNWPVQQMKWRQINFGENLNLLLFEQHFLLETLAVFPPSNGSAYEKKDKLNVSFLGIATRMPWPRKSSKTRPNFQSWKPN